MGLSVREFSLPLEGLTAPLERALQTFDDSRALMSRDDLDGAPFTLVGPFPAYSLDPRAFVADQLDASKETGWRALVLRGETSLALADITLNRDGFPAFAFRGAEPAAALHDALQEASQLNERAGNVDVRWLSITDVYVTTLWLEGRERLFVPTRLGRAERVKPEVISFEGLRRIVAELLEQALSDEDKFPSGDPSRSRTRSGLRR
jgi:hypothetical protein